VARTLILDVLDQQVCNARTISKETSQSYSVVLHHLQLLRAEGTVSRRGKKPYTWMSTGLGQKRLVN